MIIIAYFHLKSDQVPDVISDRKMTFYGVLGQILLLLDTHIAHKDILFLYELIFYAVLD